MKNLIISLFLITSNIYPQTKLNIAVLDLEGTNISATNLTGFSNRLRTELFKTNAFNVFERNKMNKILEEQGFQLSGCTSNKCAVEIGKIIGVKKIIVGNVDKVGSIYSLNIRMVDIETGQIDNIVSEDCIECEVSNLLIYSIPSLSRKIAKQDIKKINNYNKSNISNTTNVQKTQFDLTDKNYHVISIIGLSFITGLTGIEIQIKKVSFNIGTMYQRKNIMYGIKYYINQKLTSIYIAAAGGMSGASEPSATYFGAIIGYRWQIYERLELNLGIGYPFITTNKEYSPFLMDLGFGYCF
jgi:hypothetical protein